MRVGAKSVKAPSRTPAPEPPCHGCAIGELTRAPDPFPRNQGSPDRCPLPGADARSPRAIRNRTPLPVRARRTRARASAASNSVALGLALRSRTRATAQPIGRTTATKPTVRARAPSTSINGLEPVSGACRKALHPMSVGEQMQRLWISWEAVSVDDRRLLVPHAGICARHARPRAVRKAVERS
jgi:hypothetical protein